MSTTDKGGLCLRSEDIGCVREFVNLAIIDAAIEAVGDSIFEDASRIVIELGALVRMPGLVAARETLDGPPDGGRSWALKAEWVKAVREAAELSIDSGKSALAGEGEGAASRRRSASFAARTLFALDAAEKAA